MMSLVFPRSIRGIFYLVISIIILACSPTSSENLVDDSDVLRYFAPCGEEKTILRCKLEYDDNRSGASYSTSWYHLSARQLELLNTTKLSDLSEYAVRGTYSTSYLGSYEIDVGSTIDDVSVYDSGWYSCLKASNDGKIEELIRLWLEVDDCADGKGDERQKQKIQNNEGAPYFANRKVAKYVSTNSKGPEITQIAIGCRFRAYPRPTNITWLINGQPVKNRREDPSAPYYKNNAFSTRSYIEATNSTQNVTTDYTIHICNANGCIERTFLILPITSSEKNETDQFIIETHENVTIQAGESITLEYEFENRTQPWTAEWIAHDNGKTYPLKSENNEQSFVAAYTITETLNKQERIYECKVSNSKWIQKHFFHVKIVDSPTPSVTTKVPTEKTPIKKKNNVACGKTAILTCNVRPATNSRIIWYHLSDERVQELIKTNSYGELSKHAISQQENEYPTRLRLKYVMPFDEGWYSCVEQVETDKGTHSRVLISRLLEISNCPANYTLKTCIRQYDCTNKTYEISTKLGKNGTVTIESHDNVNVLAGKSVTLECQFSRRGFAEYEWILEWSHNNGTIRQCKNSEDLTKCAINDYVSTYPVQKVTSKDEGTYECRVSNWKWIQKQFFHVKIQ
ncbi:uncharacterized protein LOC135839782 [Planococcus citri]|uniref:uncharacterized protein LOC135839782 n=1 Tax=Planococcus citri TaxID=170843 RepID=UPI0031F8C132